jgi:two-component system sensor kinase FixL
LRELRWLVSLRWLAGIAIVSSVAASLLWTEWSPRHVQVGSIGLAILAYNTALRWLLRRPIDVRGVLLAWAQMLPDLLALALLTLWTGGAGSPLVALFLPHMVLAGLILPRGQSYVTALVAALLLFGGAWTVGQWPQGSAQSLLSIAWILTLPLTIYLTNHITEGLRSHERELDRQTRRLSAILDHAVEAIITIDERGIIQSTNRAAERIFGYEASELIGRSVNIIVPEPDRARHDEYLSTYLATGVARIIGIGREVKGQRRDGVILDLDLSVAEVQTADGRLFTGIIRDITDRKKADAELQSLNEALKRQQETIVQHEKMVALGRMAAGVAHEISNPLASLDSLLQLLERKPDRFTPSSVQKLREQVVRIVRIVREMTTFSHPNETAWETKSVSRVVDGALDMLRFDHRIRAVRVERAFSEEPDEVRMMPQGIQQVIVNLMSNALDAVADVADPCVVISTRSEDGMFVIEIEDNGVGIEPEHLDRVLDPFFTTKPIGRGTGLGLSISYSLVERHGGRLEVRSIPGEGAAFTIRLPVSPGAGTA